MPSPLTSRPHHSITSRVRRSITPLMWVEYLVFISCLFFASCDDQPSADLEQTDGPQVIFEISPLDDSEQSELSELSFPLPNDAIFSTKAPSWRLKSSLSQSSQLNRWAKDVALLGGAPLTPLISIPLTQAIDLDTLISRQRNKSLLDDAIYLVCLSEHCKGDLIPLDFGTSPINYGLFSELNTLAETEGMPTPQHLTKLSLPLPPIFKSDRSDSIAQSQMLQLSELFQAENDDSPLSSLIWPSEQQNSGQHFMTPAPSLGEESVILTFKPQQPLRPHTRYAVTLTRALSSAQGPLNPVVRGSADAFNQDRSEVVMALESLSIAETDVLLTWSFTTGDPNELRHSLREALLGESTANSALSQRVSSLPLTLKTAHTWTNQESISACQIREGLDCRADNEQIALLATGTRGLALAWAEARQSATGTPLSPSQKTALYESYQAVRGLFSGVLNGWTVTQWSGNNTGDELKLSARSWPFWCVIPESGEWVDQDLSTRQRQSPYPVLIWSTDSTRERLDLLLHAGHFARAGFASCALETTQLSAPESLDKELFSDFAFRLSVEWREYAWSSALALSYLHNSTHRSTLRADNDERRLRPLNRSLALQQLVHWLGQGDEVGAQGEGAALSTLRNLIALPGQEPPPSPSQLERVSEFPLGALVYGGEGEGATTAMLSVLMDQDALAVTSVDAVADYLKHSAVGVGRGGADVFVNRQLGPWLVWDGSDTREDRAQGWQWSGDSIGQAPMITIRAMLATAPLEDRLQVLDERVNEEIVWQTTLLLESGDLEGRWVALYNHRSGQLGERVQFYADRRIALKCPSERGDPLSLFVFRQESDIAPSLISEESIISPSSSLGALPATEGVRRLWRLLQWRDALDDPIASSLSDLNARALLLAHPRSEKTQLSASLSIASSLDLFNEESRQDLYELNEERFLILSQAYEPQRAWGVSWIDWDDLDLLEIPEPSFTRNVQLGIGRSAFAGGYHALRIPWRSHRGSGLSLADDPSEPLGTLTINLVNRFLNGLSHNASLDALNDICLNYLAPSTQACSFLSITGKDTPLR